MPEPPKTHCGDTVGNTQTWHRDVYLHREDGPALVDPTIQRLTVVRLGRGTQMVWYRAGNSHREVSPTGGGEWRVFG